LRAVERCKSTYITALGPFPFRREMYKCLAVFQVNHIIWISGKKEGVHKGECTERDGTSD
jgi:hypothetical protein